jgi:uncharacterized protein YkwD
MYLVFIANSCQLRALAGPLVTLFFSLGLTVAVAAQGTDSPMGGCWIEPATGRSVNIDFVLDRGGRIDPQDPNRAYAGLEVDLAARTQRPRAFLRAPCPPARPEPGEASVQADPEPQISRADLAVLEEINAARADPQGYAQRLRAYLTAFRGRLVEEPGHMPIMSQEGPSAVEEAIADLERRTPAPPLSHHSAAARAALRMVADQGPSGRLGHVGSDGSTLRQRLQEAGLWAMAMEEDISYGEADPQEVVRQLIVDDGVPDRGHRLAVFDPHMSVAGVACGPHAAWRWMCVVDFAGAVMPAPGSQAATR